MGVRDDRSNNFEEDWLPKFKAHLGDGIFYDDGKFCFTIKWCEMPSGEERTIDFYPKANKVLIRYKNEWIKPGLNWLIKNVLQ